MKVILFNWLDYTYIIINIMITYKYNIYTCMFR